MSLTPVQLLEGDLAAVPERAVRALAEQAGAPVALYVLDLEGRLLCRAAGDLPLAETIELPRRIGPVLFRGCADEVIEAVARAGDGACAHPLWLRGQAAVVAVTAERPGDGFAAALDAAAVALEVASQHTDVLHIARRRKETTPAAELQQELLPPPIVRAGDAELAGVILPAYTVGGDWFDWSQLEGELRFSVGDAVGRGERAMGLGAVALSANRAARRRAEALEDAARRVNEAVARLGGDLFVTTVLASWDHGTSTVRWIRCGHPVPVHLRADGTPV
ncbi:MAG TPA: SpoIIE family protein phosphatase, partial [Capillimicrobium sp.]